MSDKRCGVLNAHGPHSWGDLNWCPGSLEPVPMTLTDFLLARIAEDETDYPAMFADRKRVLAECKAKRGAIEAAWRDHVQIEGEWGMCQTREQMDAKDDVPDVIAHLALPYADHPDYREEWRP